MASSLSLGLGLSCVRLATPQAKKTEDQKPQVDDIEIMSVAELKDFAEAKDIDINGLRLKEEIKSAIRKAMN